MSVIHSTSPLSKADLLKIFGSLFPLLGEHRLEPVRRYAKAIFDTGTEAPVCETRKNAQNMLLAWIREVALKDGFTSQQADHFAFEIQAFPVVQTGPHLHLLVEPDAFYTHLFSLMGLQARQSRCYVSYACSTVKFVERSRKGPGWLIINGQPINVFGLTRKQMIPTSIFAKNGSYRFHLRYAEEFHQPTDLRDKLLEDLPTETFPSASEAIRKANISLWRRYFGTSIDFLQVDDDDVANLVAYHLLDEASWLQVLLVDDGRLASEIISEIDQLTDGPWRGWLKNSTHFFWGCRAGRIYPMILDHGVLRSAVVNVPFSATALLDGLRSQLIIPNLFTVFLVLSIIPGIRVLGGSRHSVYYPLMRSVICRALTRTKEQDPLLKCLLADKIPFAWGHRVISAANEPLTLLQEYDVETLIRSFGSLSLESACGDLSSFINDPLWQEMQSKTF